VGCKGTIAALTSGDVGAIMPGVCSTLRFLLVRRVLGVLHLGPNPDDKDIEIAVLRHQLFILERQARRPRDNDTDRLALSTLAGLVPRERWSVFLVTPATVLRWHRELVRRHWAQPHRPPRRALPEATVDVVLRPARENPRWGYVRIAGECAKLGVAVSASSVRNCLRRHHLGPAPRRGGPTWVEFLRSQASGVLACDFFSVETVGLQRRYVLFFIELERRQVFLAGVTTQPDGRWATQQAPNLAMELNDRDRRFRFLIRDRDAKFVADFDTVFASEGTRVIKTPVRSPRANGYAERFVGTARRECLDWMLMFGRHHLERVLAEFVAHYNKARPHRGIDLDAPIPLRPVGDTSSAVERVDRLGGLIHEYRRAG
jgi:putative transposase